MALREDRSKAGSGSATTATDADEQPRKAPSRIECATCGNLITRGSERISVAGRDQHTCVNPAGYVYRIRCYRTAPGCIGQGAWSSYHSWFVEHEWQIACCRRCSAHLGWAFRGTEEGFFGLITGRIRERSGDA